MRPAILALRLLPAALLLAAAALAGCVPATNLPEDCDAAAVTRPVTLATQELTPATIEVCQGQEVTIQVTPEVDATLHFHGYDDQLDEQELTAGEVLDVVIEATHVGQFPIEMHTHDGEDETEVEVGHLIVNEH
jgi:hypothetical protein